jgi:hypothetical protein
VIAGLYRRGKLGQLYMVSTSPEKALAIGRFMTTLILEVGTRFEFYISVVIIMITRQRPKPLLRPPMPLPTKLWREWNHSIFFRQILRILGKREELLILRGCPGSPPGFLWVQVVHILSCLCFVFFCIYVFFLRLV